MKTMFKNDLTDRIEQGLNAAREVLKSFTPGNVATEYKSGGDPVTAADRAVDDVLKERLVQGNEGWLSEETADDLRRLACRRVWIVDPLDGTREFVAGIPEWAISIGYVEDGNPVAGGICNPQTGETFIGCVGQGVTYNGKSAAIGQRSTLTGALVLASRSEVNRGEWKRFSNEPFEVKPVGSVAYKLALVAAGLADATWTLTPKNEWDVAAGVALMNAAGGTAYLLGGDRPSFNNQDPLISGLIAHPTSLRDSVGATLDL